MVLEIGKNRSRIVAYLAVFIALVTVFDAVPIIPGLYSGVWDSWIFLLSPIIGVLLGPLYAILAVGLGSYLGHFIYFRDPFEFLFLLGAVLGTACAALIFQHRWKPVLIIYSVLLAGYFLTPVTWFLPLIGIWDILLAYVVLLFFILLISQKWWPAVHSQDIWLRLLFCVIIGLEADILFRVFILVPGQTYWLFYGWTVEVLQILWLTAGIITPTKVALATLFTVTIGFSLLQILPRTGISLSAGYHSMNNTFPPRLEIDN
ncbi:MAG: hypothetical protein ACFFBX_08870 [Promethearchaeota archaeon]